MEAAQWVGFMIRIQSGPAASVLAVANDGIGHARTVGLFLSANSRKISAQLLQAASREGAVRHCGGASQTTPRPQQQPATLHPKVMRLTVASGPISATRLRPPTRAAQRGGKSRKFMSA